MVRPVPEIQEQGLRPLRGKLLLQEGEYVRVDDQVYRIKEVVDSKSVFAVHVQTHQSSLLSISDLRPVMTPNDDPFAFDLGELQDSELTEALRRYAAIAPFVHKDVAGVSEVQARAEECGVHPVTLYRWLGKYQARNSVAGLIRQKRGWKAGQSRLSEATVKVIEEVLENYYLTPKAPTAVKAIASIRARCEEVGVPIPSGVAIRHRISQIPEETLLKRRGKRKRARDRFHPVPGTHPGGHYPIDVVQSDHTKLDLIVVDDRTFKPIGRPYLTLVVCLYSRMISGYYLSLDPPGEASVGLAMAHSILPKEEWLIKHDIQAEWPVWGFPRLLQVDNGADFRSDLIQRACGLNGITLEFCPVRLPNYKGAVERIYRTINQELHELPGTTFSNTVERAEYDAEKEASLTMADLHRWLLNWICNVYHVRPHRTLKIAPLSRWLIGTEGDGGETTPRRPALPLDRRTVQLDFTPMERRTIQTTGVEISGLRYWADCLGHWVNRPHPSGEGKLFIFRRDPSDLSKVWFYDPKKKEYFVVPLADKSRVVLSLFELNRGKQLLKARGFKLRDATEGMLFKASLEGREIAEKAQKRSASARRDTQRSRHHREKVHPADPLDNATKTLSAVAQTRPAPPADDDDDDVRYTGVVV